DVLVFGEEFRMPELTADAYMVEIRDAPIRYQRIQLVRNALPWRYQGVLHEFLTCEGSRPSGHLPIVMLRNHDGARRRGPRPFERMAQFSNARLRRKPTHSSSRAMSFTSPRAIAIAARRERQLRPICAALNSDIGTRKSFIA